MSVGVGHGGRQVLLHALGHSSVGVAIGSVTEIDFGGQVEKYPAEEPEPATEAVIAVVPGISAVIWLVTALMVPPNRSDTCKSRRQWPPSSLGTEVDARGQPAWQE